jgi:RNA polymerase sigma factor (sigma-70 family)
LKVHRSLSQWKGEASLRTWIVRTAVRTAIDARRGVARRREVVPGAEPAHDPRQRLERVLMLARVRELAESVDGQQGVILRLRLFGGLTNKEVAASLGLTESNVRAQLTNAVRLLRRGL